MPMGREARLGVLLAGVFFALGALVNGDIGPTADEIETLRAGQRNLEILEAHWTGDPPPTWSFHEVEGFYFVMDTARALWGAALGTLGVEDPLQAQHLFHLLLSSLTLWLLFALTRQCGASARAAGLAALALAVLPQFVAHSQNNPKDLPATFTFTLAIYCMIGAGLRGGWARTLLGGVALGLALTTRVHSVFAPVIAWAWLILSPRQSPPGAFRRQVFLAVAGLVFSLAFWPRLWPDPIGLALEASQQLTAKVFTLPVLYLGQVYSAHEIPWHYRPVLLAATTPSLLLLAGGGLTLAFGRGPNEDKRDAARLAVLWLSVLLLADGLTWSRYDGLRHFLLGFPAVALLAGLGGDAAVGWLQTRNRSGALGLLALVPFAASAWTLATLHPYAGASLNAPTRWLLEGPSDESFELEYWGQSYLEGARWIASHGEPDAEVIVPLFADLARQSSDRPVRAGRVADWEPTDRPRYLMMITRRAYYDPPLAKLERQRVPLFEISRSGGSLLTIYGNDAAGTLPGSKGTTP